MKGLLGGIMFHGEHCSSCRGFVYDLSAVSSSYQLLALTAYQTPTFTGWSVTSWVRCRYREFQ
jgi:hypothetical protein